MLSFVIFLLFFLQYAHQEICNDDTEYLMKSDAYQWPSIGHLFLEKIYHEWWFFTVNDPEQDIGLAFGIGVTDPKDKEKGYIGYNIMAYTQFTHENDSYAPSLYGNKFGIEQLHASEENASLSFPEGEIEVLREGLYRVRVANAEQKVEIDLTYEKVVDTAHQEEKFKPIGLLSWQSYMPTAKVSGHVSVDGKEYTFKKVKGYHDKNWGAWPESYFNWVWSSYGDVEQELGIVWGAYKIPLTKEYIGYLFLRHKGKRWKIGTLCLNPFSLEVLAWKEDEKGYKYASHLKAETSKGDIKVKIEIQEHVSYENPGGKGLGLIVFEMISYYHVTVYKGDEILVKSEGYGFNEWSDIKTQN